VKTPEEQIAEIQAKATKDIENIQREAAALTELWPVVGEYEPRIHWFKPEPWLIFRRVNYESLRGTSGKDPDTALIYGLLKAKPPVAASVLRGNGFMSVGRGYRPTMHPADARDEIFIGQAYVEADPNSFAMSFDFVYHSEDGFRVKIPFPLHMLSRVARHEGSLPHYENRARYDKIDIWHDQLGHVAHRKWASGSNDTFGKCLIYWPGGTTAEEVLCDIFDPS
jgi:hypothetical protein